VLCKQSLRGHRITTRDYKKWLALVERHIPDGIPDWSAPYVRLSVEIELHSERWFAKKGVRKVDVDNFVKTTLDAIFKNLPFDDAAIFHLTAHKVVGTSEKTVVRIGSMDES
jgi:Holliday junction resolvase RusA-like endonuclease